MYETLLRPHEVQQLPSPLSLNHIVDKLKKMEQNREEKRLRQIANASKRKREDDPSSTESEKRARTEETSAPQDNSELRPQVTPPVPVKTDVDLCQAVAQGKVNLSKASPEVRGHTSYLTFARLVPLPGPMTETVEENPPVSS